MTTKPEYTQAALESVLGSAFQVKPQRRGSFQVNLANLKGYDNEFDKVATAMEGFKALQKAGYPVTKRDFRISQPRGDVYISWVCIWVNQPQAQATDVAGELVNAYAKAEELGLDLDGMPEGNIHRELAWLRTRIAKHNLSPDPDGDAVETDDEPF